MTYVVGDIHGEITKLKSLINNITDIDKNPSYVFIGDYLDKGENVFETLKFLIKLNKNYNCTFLIGNHEFLWIKIQKDDEATYNYLMKYGALATINSFGCKNLFEAKEKILQQFGDFFNLCKPYWNNTEYIAVHSGIMPQYFETSINDIPLDKFLFNRYEFIKTEKFYLDKFKVIFGHTGFLSPYIDTFKIGIDTAACFLHSQPLTAFNTEKKIFINSKNDIYSINDIPLNQCPIIPRNIPYSTI